MSGTRVFLGVAAARAVFAVGLLSCVGLSAQAPPAPEPLRPGDTIEVVLAPGQSRAFAVALRKGELLEGVVQFKSASEPLMTLRLAEGPPGVETGILWPGTEQPFFAVAQRDGKASLLFRPAASTALPVRFAIRVEPPRAANARDRWRVQALDALRSGSAAIDRGDWNGASVLFRKSRDLWKRAGDVRGEGQALHMLGYACRMSEPACALDFYAQALERRQTAGDEAGRALTLKNIGEAHRRMSRFAEAEIALEQSREAWRTVGDRGGEAGSINNLATIAMMRGDYRKAVELLREALAIQEELSDVDGQARALSNISTAYRSLGELGEALDSAERSLPLRRQVADKRGEAFSLGNIGDSWRALGEPERALEYDLQALRAMQEYNPKGIGEFLITLAQSQMALGDDQEALDTLERTVTQARAEGIPRLLARSQVLSGDLLARRGSHREALDRYEAALGVMEGAPDPTYETAARASACREHVALGQFEAAEAYCRRATELAEELRLPTLESLALVASADLARARGRLSAAAADLDRAFAVMEAVRDRVPTRERASYLADRQKPYRFWIDVLSELDRTAPREGWDRRAFHAAERMKARALLEEVIDARGDVAQSVDPRLGAKRRELEASLGGTQRALSSPALPEADRRRMEARLANLETDYERLVREVSRRGAARAALRYPRPAGAVEVAAALPEGVVLVAYALGESAATAFVVRRDGFRAVTLPSNPQELDRLIRNYTELLSRPNGAAAKMAARLGRELLAPIAPDIPGSARGLVIVPDGPLHALPFEALPGLRGSATLLEELSVGYVPSATLYVALRGSRPSEAPAALLALADPAAEAELPDSERMRFLYEQEGLAAGALPHASREARALSRLAGWGSEVYVGAEATEGRAKEKLSKFGILHFATHGLVSERHPPRSALRLAAQGSEDGFLQAREIANLRVAADLVVLSGCRTARGRLLAGEGPQSLARAFFQAGAGSVVASLWDVGDEATARLMRRFYGALAAGRSRGDALREAKLALLSEGRPPSDWAAFVLLGEGEGGAALQAASRWRVLLLPLALVVAGALALIASARGARGFRP